MPVPALSVVPVLTAEPADLVALVVLEAASHFRQAQFNSITISPLLAAPGLMDLPVVQGELPQPVPAAMVHREAAEESGVTVAHSLSTLALAVPYSAAL